MSISLILEGVLENSCSKGHTGIPELWTQVLDAGLWMLDSGRWTLGVGLWTLGSERWKLDCER